MRTRDQFVTMTKSGDKRGTRHVLVQSLGRDKFVHDPGALALGLTASRKVGNAVLRNRAKRRLRHIGATLLPHLGLNDRAYVFVANARTPKCRFDDLMEDVRRALVALRTRATG